MVVLDLSLFGPPVPPTTTRTTRAKKTTGLRYWMLRVREECETVAADFPPDPVHDLRVALRRCRSMADGLMAIDPDPDWKAMRKAGKRLFQRLGDLRDIHVMVEWVEKLHPAEASMEQARLERGLPSVSSGPALTALPPSPRSNEPISTSADSAAQALLKILAAREQEQKQGAQAALEEFDRKQWRQWSKSLPARAVHVRSGSPLFKHLALERW